MSACGEMHATAEATSMRVNAGSDESARRRPDESVRLGHFAISCPVRRLGSCRQMIVTSLARPLLIALIAVLPGAFSVWRWRTLARLADDPTFPERLLANRTRNQVVLGGPIADRTRPALICKDLATRA